MALHLHFTVPRGTRQIAITLVQSDTSVGEARVTTSGVPLPVRPWVNPAPGLLLARYRRGMPPSPAQRFAPVSWRHAYRAWTGSHTVPPKKRP